ncbi:CPBP family intramembrane metalloprotease [Roseiconus nitratireducens]|uniref:CPBP family intramembrane metalloprotease n=1 Tax=Roseiconus nitratireducens TaxID=2605748 RepID=A0A5M6CYV5_9BACT|nr:CPBP family glutamic-type intramembrane protease [Roseiconus nitratireducens]KAA5540401.1 CPBP family intramembrane metalloprotease [Roseiconus nitratireducens]
MSDPQKDDPAAAGASVDSGDQSSWRSKAAMIVPLAIFFALGAVIDTSPKVDGDVIDASAYLTLVAARVLLMTGSLIFFTRQIATQFQWSVDRLGVIVGIVGALLWIGICEMQIERGGIAWLGLSPDWLPEREGVNPWMAFPGAGERGVFLILRFVLLVICVPIAEELFMRGFLMRAVEVEDWTRLPLSQIGRTGLVVGTVYAIASHPGEAIAATLWFSLVSWLMLRTGRFWNCVLAHAITNLLLGVYVCLFERWWLW